MAGKVVLISDDTDFFEYIKQKLELRKSDELFAFSFDSIPEKLQLISTAVLIINSENNEEKTLDLLKLLQGTPAIVFAYNEDDIFRRKCYRLGMLDYMTILTPDSEFRARIIPALTVASLLEKNGQYRKILELNNQITPNNEVFLNYNSILDNELKDINSGKKNAVFAAIAPNDKTKFKFTANMIESVILDNIRLNDILMTYAPNKYFLLMYDTNIKSAQILWQKISGQFQEKIYAGFVNISNQRREQLINEVLNKLHEAINNDKLIPAAASINGLESYSNFKLFRQEFDKKFEQIITPVFYQIQQKYSKKFIGISILQDSSSGLGTFYIKGKNSVGSFRITSPGFSKINIDITYQKNTNNIDAKRITLEPDEFESGILEDLLEQFVSEYKRGLSNDNT